MQQGLSTQGRAKPEPTKNLHLSQMGDRLQRLGADDVIWSLPSLKKDLALNHTHLFFFLFFLTGTVNNALSVNDIGFLRAFKGVTVDNTEILPRLFTFSLKRKDGDGNVTLFNNERVSVKQKQ